MIKEIKINNERLKVNLSNDKQGRTVWKCPKCNHTLVTFYSEVETIRNIDECKYCGQKLIMPGGKYE